jgi:peroxiredoxin Q/BCP
MCLCANKVFAMHGKTTIVAIITMSLFGFGSKVKALEVGAPAPVPAAVDQDGKPFAFADVYAKGITLVYFYPKADTPGCTAQACSLRDSFESLKAENLQIVGVSRDTPASQKKFQQKYNLPFSLVADADGKVAEATGACIMMVQDGVLVSPPVTEGILDSLTRKVLAEMFWRGWLTAKVAVV